MARRVLIHVLLQGLRCEQVLRLSIASVKTDKLFVYDARTCQERTIDLNTSAVDAIEDYLEWRCAALKDPLPADAPLVVSLHPGYRGQNLSYGGLYKAIGQIGTVGYEELYSIGSIVRAIA